MARSFYDLQMLRRSFHIYDIRIKYKMHRRADINKTTTALQFPISTSPVFV